MEVSILTVGGPDYRELQLETSEQNKIPNIQSREISASELNELGRIEPYRGQFVERRCGPTPIYNCHGMVFASRRTGICESEVIYKILADDKYIRVSSDKVIAGDIILYIGKDGDIEHSGIVVDPPRKERYGVAIVCSKWGKYAEGIHLANNVPYDYSEVRYYRVKR